jgi:guanylate kinase
MKGKLIIIAGPSASGKTELVKRLIVEMPNSARLITTTTRQPRHGEVSDYFFMSRIEFQVGIRCDEFFEYAEVYGNLYGVSKKVLATFLDKYDYVFSIMDVQGTQTLKSKIPEALTLFIQPDSLDDIRRRILKERGDIPSTELEKRLETASTEMELAPTFEVVVNNKEGKFEEMVQNVIKVLNG